MNKIKDKWENTYFVVASYRDDKHILKEVEEVITQLEDDSLQVSTMMGSKFVNEIKEEVQEWETRLGYISDVIDEWLTFQKNWMYLESIFSAEDIQQQLKAESKQFTIVNKFWMDHMNKVKQNAKVIGFADSGGLKKKFVENNKKLDEIQKGLSDYLGTKRAAFPRFYFLSDDELIEILSQTRNVQAVQPHLQKCFDNIKKVEFTREKDSKEIIGMWSGEGEYVAFSQSVFAHGVVETWLSKIEDMMIQSLYDQTRHAQENYPEDGTQRDKWLFDYAAQPVLTIDMVQWTAGVTAAIKEIMSGVNAGALNEFLSFSELQLDNMIKLVRGKLDKLQRAALGALIVLDVHAKYVVTDFLIKNRVENINSFDWQQQLRYYWEELLEDDGD